MRRVAILGSTGSIGTQALDVIAAHPDHFCVAGLAAGRNTTLLAEQVARFGPDLATTASDGPGALMRVALETRADIVLAATDGFVAFEAVYGALKHGIDVALANKELVVAAGDVLLQAARTSGAQVLPVDSEHSAIFQCLIGEDPARVASIILTASGGPFRDTPLEQIPNASLAQALNHPTWRMGTKNTIDSATMMNKGLEVIEASRLFGVRAENIGVVIHRQSIAHGFVVFTDGSVKGQLCAPDMRVPIGFALAYPDRLEIAAGAAEDPIAALGGEPGAALLRYEFERPSLERFPCLGLAYEALRRGGTSPAILSAANELAVDAFVAGLVPFGAIPELVASALDAVAPSAVTWENVLAADAAARAVTRKNLAGATLARAPR